MNWCEKHQRGIGAICPECERDRLTAASAWMSGTDTTELPLPMPLEAIEGSDHMRRPMPGTEWYTQTITELVARNRELETALYAASVAKES